MKIQGPSGPRRPARNGSGPREAARANGSSHDRDRERSHPAAALAPIAELPPDAADAIAALADQVEAGALAPAQAMDSLLELVIQRGALASLPEPVRSRLRAQLAALMKEDAYLAEKARRAGMVRSEEDLDGRKP
jgi:hypothetical protein